MNITNDYREKVRAELIRAREKFTGTDTVFASQYGINNTVYSRLKAGQLTGLLRDAQWLNIGRRLQVSLSERTWNVAQTDVYKVIAVEVMFCKEFSKSRIFIDDCGIGKSFTAKHLAKKVENCFYIDASQAKTKSNFIRLVASVVGVDSTGKINEVKEDVKYYLNALPAPVVIIDEAGDLEYTAFLSIKEFWNATEDRCGWFLMGAEGMRAKIDKGIDNKKVGYREIFSRFSEKYSSVVPVERSEKRSFYRKLISDVLIENMEDKQLMEQIVQKSLIENSGRIGGLRRAESLLILNR